MLKKISFAVVGCGQIGKRHAGIIEQSESCELAALIDIKKKETLNLEAFQAPFFQSLEAYLNSGEVADVITLATPNGLHYSQALQVLEACRHVVIEKPMALKKEEAEHLMNLAQQKNLRIFMVMQNRYSPPSQWLKNMVDSGTLGDIYMVQMNCYWNRDERYYRDHDWHGLSDMDGGTLYTQFSHFIDIMYWLFGDIENISARFADFNHEHLTAFEDSGTVHFDFVNGGMGTLNFSTAVWNQNLESSLTVIAQNGSVKIGGQYMDKVEVCTVKDYEMPQLIPTNPGTDYGHYKGSAANHQHILDNIVEVLTQNGRPAVEVSDGVQVTDIICRIYAAGK